LKLVSTAEGPRLTWTPVKELEKLRGKTHRVNAVSLKEGDANPLDKVRAELLEIRAEFAPGSATEVAFEARGATITYDTQKQELVVNGHRASAPLREGKQRLTIYCDRNALELFASDGLTYVPMPFLPKADNRSVSLQAKGGTAQINSLAVYELKPAW
jgi:fructan beta-fructosidase